MKKTQPASQQKPRRLTLNRESIRLLEDSALLGLAQGGRPDDTTLPLTTQESTSGITRPDVC